MHFQFSNANRKFDRGEADRRLGMGFKQGAANGKPPTTNIERPMNWEGVKRNNYGW